MIFLEKEYNNEIFITEAEDNKKTYIIINELYPYIEKALSIPQKDKEFKYLVGKFVDKNNQKLHTSGPQYLIPFADNDKAEFLKIFDLDIKTINIIVEKVIKEIKGTNSNTDFKLLKNNPIFWVFYCCIRYYTLKKDEKSVNTALIIYALSVYPSIFSKYFKYEVSNPACMQYTMDNITNKFIIKQQGHIYGALTYSIKQSYNFLKSSFANPDDKEIIRFIQRIRNDQNSMIKKICDQYQKNFAKGLRVNLTKDSFDNTVIMDDIYNNTSVVELITRKVLTPIINNGVDLKRAELCSKLTQISISDTRYYLSKIITLEQTDNVEKFIESILFLYLYEDKKDENEINSPSFLIWASELFRKTNSNNDNIKKIKLLLDKWGEISGVHEKFKREASRVNYKKAIFFYFILSIQAYK